MFDHRHYHNTTVHQEVIEKRAPTDDSVRLLREMEASARQQVEKSFPLPSNELKGVLHTSRDPLACRLNVSISYELNGKRERVIVSLDDFSDATPETRAKKIVDTVSAHLAGTILTRITEHSSFREILK